MAQVLVVDDREANLALVGRLLRTAGHEFVTVRSGAEAVEFAHSAQVDLVLLDIQMPGMDGFETAAALRALDAYRHVPIIAVTALARPGDRDRILNAGFTGYLSKPIDAERFARQISGYLTSAGDP